MAKNDYDRYFVTNNDYDSYFVNQPKQVNKNENFIDKQLRALAEQIVKHPKLAKGIDTAAEIAQYPGAMAGGAIQEFGDLGASLANLALKPVNAISGQNYRVPHPNIREKFDENVLLDIPFLAGQLGAAFAGLGGLGTGRGVTQALQNLPRSHGYRGLLEDALKGAATGYALGETSEGDRTLGTAFGAVAQPLASLTSNAVANRILKDRERLLREHGQVYEDIFGAARQKNVGVNKQNLDWNDLENLLFDNKAPLDFRKIIEQYIDNPSLDNLQLLQSEMNKYARSIEKDARFKTNSLPARLQERYETARRIAQQGQKDITESLSSQGLLEEAMRYPQVTQSYAENVAPYFNRHIEEALMGQKNLAKLPERLRKDELFMNELGDLYPELKLNKYSPAKIAGLVGAALAASKSVRANEAQPFLETENYSVYD